MNYRITPPEEIIESTIELPLSKSEAARAMVCSWLAGDREPCRWWRLCDDTRVLARSLKQIDMARTSQPDDTPMTLDLEGSGTALRILTAICAATDGLTVRLTGNDSLRQRPMAELVDVLREMGAQIRYAVREGYAPLIIEGRQLQGGCCTLSTDTSSQYATAMLLAAPLMKDGIRISLTGSAETRPYVEMTARIMAMFGAKTEYGRDEVSACGALRNIDFTPDRDWSAAAFWFEIAALSAGWITLPGLKPDSLQGDSQCRGIFAMLGAVCNEADDDDDDDAHSDMEPGEGLEVSATPDLFGSVEADLSAIPDCVPALAVTACLAGVPFRFSGVGALRFKECNRLEALIEELGKLGFVLETDKYDTELVWDGSRRPAFGIPALDSHNDHRMAMALAPVALYVPGLVLCGTECVSKSYPHFWTDFSTAGFQLQEVVKGGAE